MPAREREVVGLAQRHFPQVLVCTTPKLLWGVEPPPETLRLSVIGFILLASCMCSAAAHSVAQIQMLSLSSRHSKASGTSNLITLYYTELYRENSPHPLHKVSSSEEPTHYLLQVLAHDPTSYSFRSFVSLLYHANAG